jgi:hypothetical protein
MVPMTDDHDETSAGSRWFDEPSPWLDRFGLLLGVTVLGVVALALVDFRSPFGSTSSSLSGIGVVVMTVLVSAMLLLALRAAGIRRRWRIIADWLVGAAVAAAVLVVAVDAVVSRDLATYEVAGPSPLWVSLGLLAPIVVIRRLLRHRRATRSTLLGAVSAYLLIAVAFAFVFLSIDRFTPFFGAEEPTTTAMYYSLVTITTLGYGDVVAATSLGRLLSTLEAVVGQVYLVTLVAMIVGLLTQARQTDAT